MSYYKRRHHGDASSALERRVLNIPKFLRRHDFQAKRNGCQQCTKFTKFGSHAVGLQKNSSRN